MKKQEFLLKAGLTVVVLINLLLKPNIALSQSKSDAIDFKVNYSQESLDKSNKSKNTVEVSIDIEPVKDVSKYFIKLARISGMEAENIYQKVIDFSDVKKRVVNPGKDGIILTDREIIFFFKNIPGDRYEVFVRIDNTAGETFTRWKEIVLDGN